MPAWSAFQELIVVSAITPYRPIVKPVDRPSMNSVVESSKGCGAAGPISSGMAVNSLQIGA